jgi:hypothetical protein
MPDSERRRALPRLAPLVKKKSSKLFHIRNERLGTLAAWPVSLNANWENSCANGAAK